MRRDRDEEEDRMKGWMRVGGGGEINGVGRLVCTSGWFGPVLNGRMSILYQLKPLPGIK